MNVTAIPARADNYIWLIEVDNQAIVIDPSEAEVVLNCLEEQELTIDAIFITHGHEDHFGGVHELKAAYPQALVFGPSELATRVDRVVTDGEMIEVLGIPFTVKKTAGHTAEHVSFIADDALFCGDALFFAGCGRVFTGDYQAQYESLQFFNSLPDSVKVYAGHEYTLANLAYAMMVEPHNYMVEQTIEKVTRQREKDQPSLPSTIGLEKQINPFLRARSLDEFIERRNARDRL